MLLLPSLRSASDRDRSGQAVALAALAVAAVLLAGCAEPPLPDELEPTPIDAEEPRDDLEDDADLRAQLTLLQTTLDEAHEALGAAQDAESITAAEGEVERALAALLAGPDGPGQVLPLLPSETVDRAASPSTPDLLNATLSVAQDLAGSLGRDTTDVLRDPIAGDLGAWQRDPAGMVALAQGVADSASDITALEAAILDLDGEGTRALAWTFVAQGGSDLETVQAAAERAQAHVNVMRVAVDDLTGTA